MSKKKKQPLELNPVDIKPVIKLMKAMRYRGQMVYIRQIGLTIFEYLLVFKKEVYSSYMVITPKKGKKKLTKDEEAQSGALLFVGATSTIDTLLGDELSDEAKARVGVFEEIGKQAFGKKSVLKGKKTDKVIK